MAYTEEIATALEMIREAGAPVVLVGFAKASAPDPNRPWETTYAAASEQPAFAVFLGEVQRRKEGTLTHEAETKALVAASGLEEPPTIKGELRMGEYGDGARWRIIDVKPLAPDGTPILYELRVAR